MDIKPLCKEIIRRDRIFCDFVAVGFMIHCTLYVVCIFMVSKLVGAIHCLRAVIPKVLK